MTDIIKSRLDEIANNPYGVEEGERCGRSGCNGTIRIEHEHDGGCSCFAVAPCSYCMDTFYQCDSCGWSDEE